MAEYATRSAGRGNRSGMWDVSLAVAFSSLHGCNSLCLEKGLCLSQLYSQRGAERSEGEQHRLEARLGKLALHFGVCLRGVEQEVRSIAVEIRHGSTDCKEADGIAQSRRDLARSSTRSCCSCTTAGKRREGPSCQVTSAELIATDRMQIQMVARQSWEHMTRIVKIKGRGNSGLESRLRHWWQRSWLDRRW